MTWDAANIWAANLNVNGVTGWRLPMMLDTGLCAYLTEWSTPETLERLWTMLAHGRERC